MPDERDDLFGDQEFPNSDWDERDDAVRRGEDAFHETAAPAEGGGRGWKFVLLIVGVAILLIVLCCGGTAWWMSTWFGEWMQKQVQNTHDAQEIQAWTDEVIAIEIPADYTPVAGMKFGMGEFMGFTVLSYSGPEESKLVFVELSGQAAVDPGASPAQFEQSMRDVAANEAKQIAEESSEIHEIKVGDQAIDFKLVTGTEAVSGQEWSELSGIVRTSRGMVLVMLQSPSESFDEDAASSMMESIESPK